MGRCCLSVGLFLGLLAPSLQTLAAADAPPVNDPGNRQVENLSYPVDPSDVPLAAPAVRQAMQDRNFAEARKAIDEAAKAKDAPSDYLAYLRAWSLALEKQHDQAIAALEKFEKDFPQSPWLRRARFAKAQALVAKGDFRGAQAIYEQEAKYLLSDRGGSNRRPSTWSSPSAVPAPPHRIDSPTTRRAGVLCPGPGYGPGGPAMCAKSNSALAIACRNSASLRRRRRHIEKFLAAHGDDPRHMEARYRLGECLLAAGKLPEAREAWRELLKTAAKAGSGERGAGSREIVPFPQNADGTRRVPATLADGTRRVPDTLHDWPGEAAFHLAETWHCPQPGNDDELRRGVAALEDFIARFPAHELAPAAHLQIAESQLHLNRYDEAVATLQHFLQDPRWKDCKEVPQARVSLGQIYHRQKKYAEALAIWRVSRPPSGP